MKDNLKWILKIIIISIKFIIISVIVNISVIYIIMMIMKFFGGK